MSNKKNILLNVSSSLIQKAISLIYYFIIPILIIKTFGSEVNGLVSSITQFVAYISLLEMGIGSVIMYSLYGPLVKKDSEEISSILGASSKFFRRIGFFFIIYLFFLCICYPYFVRQFNYWYVLSLIIIISLSKLFEYFFGMIYTLFLRADQKDYIINIANSVSYILNLLLIFSLIKFKCNVQLVYLVSSFSYILRPVFLRIFFNRKYKYKINRKTNYKLTKQWDCLIHHIAFTVQSNTDIIVLTVFTNIINVSIYSIYNVVITGIRSIVLSFTSGIEAMFGKVLVNDNKKEIKEKFNIYAFLFYTIVAIIFSCTLILILPFIKVYTRNITDINYINNIFAYLVVFAELSYIIRLPFSNVVFAKGHFKQTRNFSIIEPVVNIALSVLLVIKYGLVGVAIGTLISMLIRSIGFIVYASKNILNMDLLHSFKYVIILYIEVLIIFIIHLLINNIFVSNYFEWIILSIITFIIVSIFICVINIFIYRNTFLEVIRKLFKNKCKI